MNKGYVYTEISGEKAAGLDLETYLSLAFTHSSKETWTERIESGEVLVDGKKAVCGDILGTGQKIEWMRPPWNEEDVPLDWSLIYEDEYLLAVNKPGGLPTLPGGNFLENTLLWQVRRKFQNASPMHRLGRATSGLLLFALEPAAAAGLSRAFRERKIRKIYRALASGRAGSDQYDIRAPIGPVHHPLLGTVAGAEEGGKASRSLARVIERKGDKTLFEVDILTGRAHQIRIHLAFIGHPLFRDPLYGKGGLPLENNPGLPGDSGYFLHAEKLSFEHPATGKEMKIEAAPPPWPF